MLTADLSTRYDRLRDIVRGLGSVVLGLSGGVDSSLLAAACHRTLGEQALAVIARSPSLPARELAGARQVAEHIGIRFVVVDTYEVSDPRYVANPRNRCYFCKDELFRTLTRLATEHGLACVAYGENLDDDADHRPGRAAADEHRVRAPLREAGLTKADVRALARALRLPVWDKPAFACLASRFPYGSEVTVEKLAQVEQAEEVLLRLGVRQVRVRHHGDLARIEVEPSDIPTVVAAAEHVVAELREVGFRHVTVDLAGYRRGGLNVNGPGRLLPLAGEPMADRRFTPPP